MNVSLSSEVWWHLEQGFELHATEFWEPLNFWERLIGFPLALFGHEVAQSFLTERWRPLPKGMGTGRHLPPTLQSQASLSDPTSPALLDLLRLACMLESDPELELSLQKYVMESILKQVF